MAFADDSAPKIDGTKYCAALSGMFGSEPTAQKFMLDGCLKNEADFTEKLNRVGTKSRRLIGTAAKSYLLRNNHQTKVSPDVSRS